MPTQPTVLKCSATANTVTITFSEPVDGVSASAPDNYTIYAPPKITAPTLLSKLDWTGPVVSADARSVVLTPALALTPGGFVLVNVKNVMTASGSPFETGDVSAEVPPAAGPGRVVRDVEDAISYPILTEEISNRPSPVSTLPAGSGMGGGGGSSPLGQLASRTVTDVLGWKVNPSDPKGFVGALTQAFTLSDVEGHVEATWNPQMPAIQTDLGGSITGAQASLYTRAKAAIDQSTSLLDTLYPLDPEADPEYVKALREMVRSQMTQIVRELSVIGLPSVLRIDTYFSILLGQSPATISTGQITFDPDAVGGTMGKLRDTYGIQFVGNPFNNSVADEMVITNFRVISDYLTSLLQSWISNRSFFYVLPDQPAFFGTQLVLISRQFNVIAETVNELRFTLDSVFIGPAERQSLLLIFGDPALPPRFLEGMLLEIEAFVGDEGPRLLKDGGKITVTNNILPVVSALLNMVTKARKPTNINELPDGFKTARVRNSLRDLQDQLRRLVELVEQVEQEVPASEFKLSVSSIVSQGTDDSGNATISIFGEGFAPGIEATVHSTTPIVIPQTQTNFFSAERVDIVFNIVSFGDGLHDITLTNPDGDSITVADAFTLDEGVVQPDIVSRRQVFCNPLFRVRASSAKQDAKKAASSGKKPAWKVIVNPGAGHSQTKASAAQVAAMSTHPATPQSSSFSNPVSVQQQEAAQKDLADRVQNHAHSIANLNQKMEEGFKHLTNTMHEQLGMLHEKLAQLTGKGPGQQDESRPPSGQEQGT
ncbi:hypothetical protein [Silvibacterium acidisoli]|uniref:hypothetical protein n=1 Tax=Acidobacteriaceae bacterium ZG23-2 TaxID=2883246 RepID=UPI00406C910B